jgi:hypothetical protein
MASVFSDESDEETRKYKGNMADMIFEMTSRERKVNSYYFIILYNNFKIIKELLEMQVKIAKEVEVLGTSVQRKRIELRDAQRELISKSNKLKNINLELELKRTLNLSLKSKF